MTQASALEIWSIVSSIVSVILAVFAIALSIYFFVAGKRTEIKLASSLTKIETQAEMLQKLAGKQLDRLTKYVTEDRPGSIDESIPQLITVLSQLPQTLIAQIQYSSATADREQLVSELITCYIAIYFYTAQTNYWSQFYLPALADFEEAQPFHTLVKRIVDLSASDFQFIAAVLAKCDANRLNQSTVSHLLSETQTFWKDQVKSSTDVYVARQRATAS